METEVVDAQAQRHGIGIFHAGCDTPHQQVHHLHRLVHLCRTCSHVARHFVGVRKVHGSARAGARSLDSPLSEPIPGQIHSPSWVVGAETEAWPWALGAALDHGQGAYE